MGESYGVQPGSAEASPPMIRIIRICRKCGAKIFSDATEALCARCVLKSALTVSLDAPVAAGDDGGSGENVEGNIAAAARDGKKASRAIELLGELGDYVLLEEIGRGGQGVVFRARQKSLNRLVALKVIGLGQWATKAHVKRFRLNVKMKDGKEKNVMPVSTAEYNPCGWRAWLDNTTITLGMQNVFDEDPPFVAGAFENGSDESLATIKGRFWYVQLKKRF